MSGVAMLAAKNKWLSLIGNKLHADSTSVTQEAMPRRWIDLIRYLDEQERNCSEARQAEAGPLIKRELE
jgi:hypothetical protein